MDGAPVAGAADGQSVGAGAVPLLQSVADFQQLFIGGGNLEALLLEGALVVRQGVELEAERQAQLSAGADGMSGNAVPLQGVDSGLHQILEVVIRDGVLEPGGQILNIARCGIVPQLVCAGHEQVEGAGAGGQRGIDLVEVVGFGGNGVFHVDAGQFGKVCNLAGNGVGSGVLNKSHLNRRSFVGLPVKLFRRREAQAGQKHNCRQYKNQGLLHGVRLLF